ncbi:hypothetical protein DESC_120147 [Desulfosarcina cetonica]|nr:hypothetical protein DESC_120147 [Desulfosarcina cetonica]
MVFLVRRNIIIVFRVMVVDMNFQARIVQNLTDVTDSVTPSRVHQDKTANRGKVDFTQLDDIEEIHHRLDKEIPQVFFLRAWKDNLGIRVQLLGGEHRRHGIEIGVHMTGDDGQWRGKRCTVVDHGLMTFCASNPDWHAFLSDGAEKQMDITRLKLFSQADLVISAKSHRPFEGSPMPRY